jgi:serine protease AprX
MHMQLMTDTGRRTFLKGAGAAGAVALGAGSATATESLPLDDELDLTDGIEEGLAVVDPDASVAGLADRIAGLDTDAATRAFEVLPLVYLRAPGPVLRQVARLDGVRYVAANRDLEYFNEDIAAETGVNTARAEEGVDGSGVHVAVIDSGVAATHPDLVVENNYQWAGNPVGSPTLWVPAHSLDTDELGHGTHCSGTIAGQGDVDGGMAPGAALTGYSTGAAVSVLKSAAAFDHLLANHADVVDVVSNSYGAASGEDFDPTIPLNVATKTAYDRGLLSVFAAGNSGPSANTLNDYAKAPWVLGVAATDDDRNVTDFSSRGRPDGKHDRSTALADGTGIYRPGVAAPGNQVKSTMSPGDALQATAPDADPFYAAISGTSMACPAVSGIAALMLDAAGDDADPLDVIRTIEATADDAGHEPYQTGAGFVDADAAVARAADGDWA